MFARDLFSAGMDMISSVLPSKTSDQERLINAQIAAYKKQTEISESQLAQSREMKLKETKRIQEKQIRSLRRGMSRPGFLDSGAVETTSSKLGT